MHSLRAALTLALASVLALTCSADICKPRISADEQGHLVLTDCAVGRVALGTLLENLANATQLQADIKALQAAVLEQQMLVAEQNATIAQLRSALAQTAQTAYSANISELEATVTVQQAAITALQTSSTQTASLADINSLQAQLTLINNCAKARGVYDGDKKSCVSVETACPTGWITGAQSRLCMSPFQAIKNAWDAIGVCKSVGGGARVCTHNDFQQMCGAGFQPFGSYTDGWYGDSASDSNGNDDNVYKTWNRNSCDNDNDGFPSQANARTLRFRCCL